MKHNAQQFEYPAAVEIFNLSGEVIRQDAPATKPAPDPTPEMFATEPTIRFPRGRHIHKCQHCGERITCYKQQCSKPYLVNRVAFCACR